jgi:tellurite resistance protein TerC
LVFIGAKLVMLYFHDIYDPIPKIPTSTSLFVIAAILTIAVIASIIKTRRDPTAKAHAGRVTGEKKKEDEGKQK